MKKLALAVLAAQVFSPACAQILTGGEAFDTLSCETAHVLAVRGNTSAREIAANIVNLFPGVHRQVRSLLQEPEFDLAREDRVKILVYLFAVGLEAVWGYVPAGTLSDKVPCKRVEEVRLNSNTRALAGRVFCQKGSPCL